MNSGRQSGFTLLELLVGLTLLGLTVAIIVTALNTSLLGADVTGKRSVRLNQIRTAQVVMRRQIEAARPVSWSDKTRNRIGFEGLAASASFVTVLPPWPGQGGPHLVRIAQDGDRLVLSRKIHSGETSSFDFSSPVDRTVLLHGIRTVQFAYYGRRTPREPARWQPAWQSHATLPSLVRLRVAFAGESGTSWPELIIAPMIGPQPR